MGPDSSAAAPDHPWRRASAQVFVADLDSPAAEDADMHHLTRVLRLREGEEVCAADGAGGWRMCELRGGELLPVTDVSRVERPEPVLTVGFAAAKGDRTEWAVRKLTEVGVDRISVLRTARSVVRWDDRRAEKQLDRMRRWALESSRQCRRLWLPEVGLGTPGDHAGAPVADAGGRRPGRSDRTILVGPEGGWTDEEREGREAVALGENMMRTETAAVVAGAAMASLRLWSDP